MFFETDNTRRIHISFKADTGQVPLEHANKIFVDRIREKNPKFEFETSYVRNKRVNFKIKGTSNVNMLIGCLKIFPGNIHSMNKKEIEDNSSFFFDIKINNDVLKNSLQSKTDETQGFIQNILSHYLQSNNFFDSCSGFTYLKKCMCVRLFYKNEIDFNYASLEFAKYSKGCKDFSYPEVKKVKMEIITAKEVMPTKRKIKEEEAPRKRRKKEKVIDIPFIESPKNDQEKNFDEYYKNLTKKMESKKRDIIDRYSDETFKRKLDEILKSLVTD